MATKFILHGGAADLKSLENEKFFDEIVNSVDKDRIAILCVYFARPEHRWDETFYEDRYSFECVDTIKSLTIDMATSENFENELINADVIFINGGYKGHLKESVEAIKDFKAKIAGKIIVGISAGANILSAYYFSQGMHGIKNGTAILPIKIFCHFDDSMKNELQELEAYKEELPLYKIPEQSYIVLEY